MTSLIKGFSVGTGDSIVDAIMCIWESFVDIAKALSSIVIFLFILVGVSWWHKIAKNVYAYYRDTRSIPKFTLEAARGELNRWQIARFREITTRRLEQYPNNKMYTDFLEAIKVAEPSDPLAH
jgi:hypothetical protein